MGSFYGELHVVAVDNRQWRLVRDLEYKSNSGRVFKVNMGFLCDLASIPRLFRPLIPVNGRHRKAAVLHDWLYAHQGRIKGKNVTRAEADLLFLEGMRACDVPNWKANLMYLAVRVGGWLPWGRQ